MKKNTHPDNYRLVVFKDMSNGDTFITKSCASSKDTIEIDGVEYPLIKREISSTSHPFYTGKMKLVDSAGRVDKFYKKFGKSSFSPKNTSESQKTDIATTTDKTDGNVEKSTQKVEKPSENNEIVEKNTQKSEGVKSK